MKRGDVAAMKKLPLISSFLKKSKGSEEEGGGTAPNCIAMEDVKLASSNDVCVCVCGRLWGYELQCPGALGGTNPALGGSHAPC